MAQEQQPPNDSTTADERSRLLHFERYSYSVQRPSHASEASIAAMQGKQSKSQPWKAYLQADLSIRWADMILLVCFFVNGLMDAGAYNAYECFVSMQTGNTIFAALGVSNLPVSSPKLAWTKSVTSVFAFLTGSFLISALHRHSGERKRWVLALNFSLQAICTFIAVLLVESRLTSGSPASDPEVLKSSSGFPMMDLVPIAVLSFQASGNIVASRMLTYNGMPTIVLTSAYNDIMSDPGLFTAGLSRNVKRNRRVGGVVLYFCGAVSGGALASSALGFAGSLWIAGAVKAAIVGAWFVWREEATEEREQSDE